MGKKKSNEKSLPINSDNLVKRKKANTDKNTQTITIKRYKNRKKDHVYLSDVFIETPSGFILKDETGMGATYLELEANRNSIIVEPIKITASSKAYKHDALYVGSSTKYHPEKSTSKVTIIKYLSNDQTPKKIVVVADSLKKVIDAIGQNVYTDYFLLIDEIDSFQLDSTYRKSMELTLDYYKLFNPKNRAMLSATGIDFTDPILSQEPVTFIKYNHPNPRNISVVTTNKKNLFGVAADTILKILKEYPDDKIFIAFNSVIGSYRLAEHFIKSGLIQRDEIKILCSSSSSRIVEGYFHELNSDKLPAKINFFTSAYFTGFDLKESYHLVSISGNEYETQALSERRLKQIAGRCRTGLLSETVIHDLYVYKDQKEPTKESLIDIAKIQADAITCNKNHYSKNSILKDILYDINNRMMSFLEDKNLRFVREDIEGNIVTSYLNIDAHLISIKVRNVLYRNTTALKDKLISEGNSVTHKVMYSDKVVEKSDTNHLSRNTQVEGIIKLLQNCDSESKIENLLSNGDLSGFQKSIVKDFRKIHEFVDSKTMLDFIKKSLLDTKDNRKFNLLMQSAFFYILPKGHIAVDRLDYHFPIQTGKSKSSVREKLTKEDIKRRMRIYLAELGNPDKNLTQTKAIRILNTFRKVYRKRDPRTGIDYYIVTQSNPLKIPVIKTKQLPKGDTKYSLTL